MNGRAPTTSGSTEIDADDQPRNAASGPEIPLAASGAAPINSAERRKKRAQADLEERLQVLSKYDDELKKLEAVASDQTKSRRQRIAARFAQTYFKVGRSMSRIPVRMAAKELATEQSSSERLAEKRDREFAEARDSFARAKVKWHLGRAVVNSEAAAVRPAKYGILFTVAGWAYVAPLLAADYLVFRAFGANYIHWYLQNGGLINLVFGFVSLAVVLDAYPDLISSNALRYVYAVQQLVGHVFRAWWDTTYKTKGVTKTWWLPTAFDFVVSTITFLAMAIVLVGWALIIGPVQHVVYLVLGAPARNAIRNNKNPRYDQQTDTMTSGADEADADTKEQEPESAPGFVIGYREKPVSLTAALATAVFFVVGTFS